MAVAWFVLLLRLRINDEKLQHLQISKNRARFCQVEFDETGSYQTGHA